MIKQWSMVSGQQSDINLFSSKLIFLSVFICACFWFPSSGFAQEDDSKNTAPPPLKILSKEETKQLNAETDVKRRTKLALDLMEIRLKKAEGLDKQERFPEMFDELGGFHALVDKTLEFLDRNDDQSGKVLNNFKRMEISLRAFLPRLELIRRDLPSKYEFYVRTLEKYVRAARSKAIDPLFGNTVVKDSDD